MTRRASRTTAALVAALGLSLVVPGAILTAGAENRTYVYKSQTIRVSGDETSTTQVNATNDGSGASQRVSAVRASANHSTSRRACRACSLAGL